MKNGKSASHAMSAQLPRRDILAICVYLNRNGPKSVDAFVEAARKEPLSSSIQVGFYQLKKQMKSSDALAVLVKQDNMIQSTVTVPEGSRASSIVTTVAKKTDF